ncbi:MAG: hypothetical protein ACKV2U_04510, partial [Bryobacteraceae bacterium]
MHSAVDNNKEPVGRFRIARPPSMQMVSRMQSIYGVDVWAADGDQPPWPERLAALGPKILSRRDLGAGIEAVWYKEGEDHLIDAHKGKVWAHRGAPEGKESGAEELVRDVINSYREGARNGFSIGPGAIVIETSLTESARIRWKNETAVMEFSTRTVSESNSKKFFDIDAESELVSLAGGSLTVLSERALTIAGFAGQELQLEFVTPKEGKRVRFVWHFPGEPRIATKPSITLTATAASPPASLEAIWQPVVQS